MLLYNYFDETSNLDELSNNELLEKLSFIEQKVDFFYRQELLRLEKLKAQAIIKDLNLFEETQKKYYSTKSIPPEVWLENWDFYLTILNEAKKRNLLNSSEAI